MGEVLVIPKQSIASQNTNLKMPARNRHHVVREMASSMKNKSKKMPDDLFGSEPHRRILQSVIDRKFLRDWDACDLIYQDTLSRPPSALSTAMIEMSRLRKFLIRHGITLPKARRNRGYWLPRGDKEKLRALLAVDVAYVKTPRNREDGINR